MILSGIIAAAGKRAGPPPPDPPPPEPVYQIVGEPNAAGSAGLDPQLPGLEHPRPALHDRGPRQGRRPRRLLPRHRHAELPHEPLWRRPGACGLTSWAVVEGQAPGVQGWRAFGLDPAHYVDVTETTSLWIGAQTSANLDSRGPSGGAATSGRRLRSFTFGNGAPDPFGSSSTKEARLCYMGHLLMENRHGLIVGATLTPATGTAEREAALAMLGRQPGRHRATLGADKAYDVADFVAALRALNVTPHVA